MPNFSVLHSEDSTEDSIHSEDSTGKITQIYSNGNSTYHVVYLPVNVWVIAPNVTSCVITLFSRFSVRYSVIFIKLCHIKPPILKCLYPYVCIKVLYELWKVLHACGFSFRGFKWCHKIMDASSGDHFLLLNTEEKLTVSVATYILASLNLDFIMKECF